MLAASSMTGDRNHPSAAITLLSESFQPIPLQEHLPVRGLLLVLREGLGEPQ
jgi:hypothetical protein